MGSIISETALENGRMQKQPDNKFQFRLPDGKTELWVETTHTDKGSRHSVGAKGDVLARWTSDGTQTRVSPAMVNDDRAISQDILHLEIPQTSRGIDSQLLSAFGDRPQDANLTLAWSAIYALWLHPSLREVDLIAIAVQDERVGDYVRCTGLGVTSPFSSVICTTTPTSKNAILWLYREAFWQGAGAPDSQHWLRSRPETTSFPGFNGTLGVFASQTGFTRQGNVCTVHPVRPPKPAPGTTIYSRYIAALGQQLRIIHIDADNPLHFETYARWQNSDRVNASWQERGSDEHHRSYLASQLADPHTMSCLFEWEGELAGYTELGWMKEDNAACFIGSNCNIVVGEHDQNSHILVGEEHLRGGKRYQAVATSIKHCCFLRDPRTRQVIAEPRFDLGHVQIQDRFLPQEKKKRFHLPHKTAMLFALQRDRFFQEGHFV